MKKIILISLIFLFSFVNISFCELTKDNPLFDTLLIYTEKPMLSSQEFNNCLKIVSALLDSGYYENVFTQLDTTPEQYTLTILFGKVCFKQNNRVSIKAFTNYVVKNRNSPEEQIFHSYREIFLNNPNLVLSEIEKHKSDIKDHLLDCISYGLLSFTSQDSVKLYTNSTIAGRRKIFFQKNPSLKSVYKKHKLSMDLIIIKASNY